MRKGEKWHHHLGLIMWVFIPPFVSSDYTHCWNSWNSNVFSFFHQPECSDLFLGGVWIPFKSTTSQQPTGESAFHFNPSPPRRHVHVLQQQHHGRHHLQKAGGYPQNEGHTNNRNCQGSWNAQYNNRKTWKVDQNTRLILDPTGRQAKLQITAFVQYVFQEKCKQIQFWKSQR